MNLSLTLKSHFVNNLKENVSDVVEIVFGDNPNLAIKRESRDMAFTDKCPQALRGHFSTPLL